jgi:AcrR family transcriptional regulator
MPKITDERKHEQRERIIHATIEVFAQHGFAGASMARIIKESGLSAGAIYTYFSTKEELEVAAAEYVLETRAESMNTIIERRPLPTPAEVILGTLGTFPVDLLHEGLLLQVWGQAVASPHLKHQAKEIITASTARIQTYLTAWYQAERNMTEDDAAERASTLAPAVAGLAQGYIMRRAIMGSESGKGRDPYLDGLELLLEGL